MNSVQQTFDSVIVGLGTTGLSVARYLARQNETFAVVDSRSAPPCEADLKKLEKAAKMEIPTHFGDFTSPWLTQTKRLVVNPGIAVATREIAEAGAAGVDIIGDVELFARDVNVQTGGENKPVVAITGSNGKTTVTSLLDLMARKSGVRVGTGGNIGTPVLNLLDDEKTEFFVIELSSYQLETTPSLQTCAAVILNISEDHLDRYDNDLQKYAAAKALIYNNCKHIVYNRDDIYSQGFAKQSYKDSAIVESIVSFGLDEPDVGDFGLLKIDGQKYLVKGQERLMPVSEVKQPGRHNIANSLAALALGDAAGLLMSAMLDGLREYPGMQHRMQWLASINNVNWYNDSKGTNVGATIAALSGLPGKTVLIAGGQGKGADFFPLGQVIAEKAAAVVLLGEDADKIAASIQSGIPVIFVENMDAAVEQAALFATSEASDNVLLSPACASFDMFENYMARGDAFINAVKKLERELAMGSHHV